jgi:phosphoenolpyruvate-protein kinase (PTS system EI component)
MGERVLRGIPAAPGIAVGAARILDAAAAAGPVDPTAVGPALEEAARGLEDLAARLRRDGSAAEADIVETGALIARDPALEAGARAAVSEQGLGAGAAILAAAEAHAELIASLPDPTLAARAADVRSVARRAARVARGERTQHGEGEDVVLVARDLGPADVAELGDEVRAIALAEGAPTAHAAIVARALGLPMVVGLGETVLAASEEAALVVDGDAGRAVLGAGPAAASDARAAMAVAAAARARAAAERELPARTRDGRVLAVLVNAGCAAEARAGFDAGAEGIGLLRTELAFLEARGWPTEEEHRMALAPIVAAAAGRPVTVRVLDFGGDKLPPFLRGTRERGTRLLLRHPEALAAQLRAIVALEGPIRVMFPLISGPVELLAARAALEEAVAAVPGATWPAFGAMVETPAAAGRAGALAQRCEFLSIGTNDLTAATLGVDRFAAGGVVTHHPRVLALVDRTVRAARMSGIPLEVCGEAASEPTLLPLLVGLGVSELSVGAARVGQVRAWVRALSAEASTRAARRALEARSAGEVAALSAGLLDEAGDAAGEGVEGVGGIVAVGGEA